MPNAIQDPLDRLSAIIEGEKSPFVELSERMKNTSKDVQNLNLSILDLAIALEKRAGVKTEKEKKEPMVEQSRNYQDDLRDFTKGFTDVFTSPFKNMKEYFTSKAEMPADVGKIKQDNIEEDDIIKTAVSQEDGNQNQNKVLADMVAVLIDMRDDKSQKQILEEAISIKKIISDQVKISANKIIEPITKESKQEDREKLAEAIARKLGEVMEELGIGSNSGFTPPAGNTPGRTPPGSSPVPSGTPTSGPGTTNSKLPTPNNAASAVALGGLAATGMAVNVLKDQSEHLKAYGGDQDKSGMLSGMSDTTGMAATILNANQDKQSEEIKKEQVAEKDKLKDAPWYTRIYGIGKEDYLKTLPAQKTPDQEASEWTQRQLELQRMYPNKNMSPKIDPFAPKPSETGIGKMLNEVNDKNTELKMFKTSSAETQMLAPIISNRTINNTEQTMIASSPSPHSSASSFVKWQMNRSNYA